MVINAGIGLIIAMVVLFLLVSLCLYCCEDDREEQPEESAEQRLARAWAEWEASVARAEAVLAGKAAPPAFLLPLPYFPYAAQGGKPSETLECAICLEPLRAGELCSEVPPCRHVFHRDCLGEWARSNGSCPLCRATIVPGTHEVAIADDMV